MQKVVTLEKVDSTNRYVISSFESLPDKALVTSKIQTAGRGRRQNRWFSPDGVNIYASYLLKNVSSDIIHTSWIGSLATLYTLRELAPEKEFWIKWPNDIFCYHKKISGVLCEIISDIHNKVIGIVIGIGININMTIKALSEIGTPATSLLVETDKEFPLHKVTEILLKHLDAITIGITKKREAIFSTWKIENKIVGKQVVVDVIGKNMLSGKVVDIKPTGELCVIDQTGTFHSVYSGDVTIKSLEHENRSQK